MGSALLQSFGAPLPIFMADGVAAIITAIDLGTQNNGIAASMQIGCSATTDSITHVGFRQGVTTGTQDAAYFTASLQSLSATTGLPDGTILGGGSPASVAFTASSANDGKWVWCTLDNAYTATRGDSLACCIVRTAATDAAHKITATPGWGSGANRIAYPIALTEAAGTWSKITTYFPTTACKSAAGVYGWPLVAAMTSRTFGGGSGGVENGFTFNVPTNFCASYKVRGVRAFVNTGSGGARVFIVGIYQNPTSGTTATVQVTQQFDQDNMSAAGSGNRFIQAIFTGTLATLTAGVTYAVGFATTSASDSSLYTMDQTSAGDFDAYEFGQNVAYCSRNPGAFPPNAATNFTVTATSRPWVELILDDLTAPAGGTGGGIRIAGHGGLAA